MTAAKKRKNEVLENHEVHVRHHDNVMEAIKAEIECQNLSYYRLSKEIGISSAALSRFRQPGGTLKTQSFLALLDYLGIDLVNREGDRVGPCRANDKK